MPIKILGAEQEASARRTAQGSHAEGYNTIASGTYSHAEGSGSNASNTSAHSEGTATNATNIASHAEGWGTTASGLYSHTEGYQTQAAGDMGHAEGDGSSASGSAAHAEGQSSVASGWFSHAGGVRGSAPRYGQWARGMKQYSGLSSGQLEFFVMGASTTSTAQTLMTFDGTSSATTSGATTNVFTIPSKTVVKYTGQICARQNVAGNSFAVMGWDFSGLVARDSSGSAYGASAPTITTWSAGTNIGSIQVGVDIGNYLYVMVQAASTTATVWFGTFTAVELTTTV